MENKAVSGHGKVSGVGEVRDKHGNLKGRIVLEGETTLSEAELRNRLGVPPPDESDKQGEEKG